MFALDTLVRGLVPTYYKLFEFGEHWGCDINKDSSSEVKRPFLSSHYIEFNDWKRIRILSVLKDGEEVFKIEIGDETLTAEVKLENFVAKLMEAFNWRIDCITFNLKLGKLRVEEDCYLQIGFEKAEVEEALKCFFDVSDTSALWRVVNYFFRIAARRKVDYDNPSNFDFSALDINKPYDIGNITTRVRLHDKNLSISDVTAPVLKPAKRIQRRVVRRRKTIAKNIEDKETARKSTFSLMQIYVLKQLIDSGAKKNSDKYCVTCGTQLKADSQYCHVCGKET